MTSHEFEELTKDILEEVGLSDASLVDRAIALGIINRVVQYMQDNPDSENHWKLFEELQIQAFEAHVKRISNDVTALLVSKRESYGPGNLTEFGDIGILIRMNDKFKRLIHMHQNGIQTTSVDESVEDALKDIIGYATLILVARGLTK